MFYFYPAAKLKIGNLNVEHVEHVGYVGLVMICTDHDHRQRSWVIDVLDISIWLQVILPERLNDCCLDIHAIRHMEAL